MQTRQSTPTHRRAQQHRVSATVPAQLLGWSLVRRVIPKLFLITLSIGGERWSWNESSRSLRWRRRLLAARGPADLASALRGG